MNYRESTDGFRFLFTRQARPSCSIEHPDLEKRATTVRTAYDQAAADDASYVNRLLDADEERR